MRNGYAQPASHHARHLPLLFLHGQHASHEPLCGRQHVPKHEDAHTDCSFFVCYSPPACAGIAFRDRHIVYQLVLFIWRLHRLVLQPSLHSLRFRPMTSLAMLPIFPALSLSPYCGRLLRRWAGVMVFTGACVRVPALRGASSLFLFASLCSCHVLA